MASTHGIRPFVSFGVLLSLTASLLTCAAEPRREQPTESRVPLFSDLGAWHHSITTTDRRAQRYFDQGLRLVYAFNHEEAIRSFEETVRIDPSAAMGWWGIALALGPNINAPLEEPQARRAVEAIEHALALAPRVSAPERHYIEALRVRYSTDPNVSRRELDTRYAEAMRSLAERYPKDPDAATLYAEALMDLRPWDLWRSDGTPQPGTLEIVRILETVLARHPDHPGACHYYIHTVEASPQPERALPCAERLPRLMPGAGHLVHMPAHIYMRLGLYDKVAERNQHAVSVDRRYLADHHLEGHYPFTYYPHNIHFLWAALVLQGRGEAAVGTARELVEQVPVERVRAVPNLEVFTAAPLLSLARFGRWQEILALPAPAEGLEYTTGVWHYARGLALVATGRLDEAQQEQVEVARRADALPSERAAGNSTAKQLTRLAALVLAGHIAAARGQYDDAIGSLQEAVQIEDQLRYNEPADWPLPVRPTLGAVLLTAGRSKEAEQVYREDLRQHPHNGWSLHGLTQALRARQADAEAEQVEREFRRVWRQADVDRPLGLEPFLAAARAGGSQ